MKQSHLQKFLVKYPNQWHSYANDYWTKNQVKKLLKKNTNEKLPFLIITNTNQMFYEIENK
tara:strand:+ start:896 stop:1078 length:183 start_codon:yes stop_codon:yes gene_type:complete